MAAEQTTISDSTKARAEDLIEIIEDLNEQVKTLAKLSQKVHPDGGSNNLNWKWLGTLLLSIIGGLLILLVSWNLERINTIDERQQRVIGRVDSLEEQHKDDERRFNDLIKRMDEQNNKYDQIISQYHQLEIALIKISKNQ